MIADPWSDAKAIIGSDRLTLGPQASHQLINDPAHYCMVLARYRAAAALIGGAQEVIEAGSGEGLGARILAKGRKRYLGEDFDADAVAIAKATCERVGLRFQVRDLTQDAHLLPGLFDAAVSLDTIEHIPADRESAFMGNLTVPLSEHGVCVIGTPNAAFDHLASPQSKAGHINTYTHERLHALMSKHFRVVQSFGMQDTSLHLGHPDARHYLLMCGIGPMR